MINCSTWCVRHQVLQALPESEIEGLASMMAESRYAPKRVIFGADDAGNRIYFIRSGHVRLYRLTECGKEISLGVAGPRDLIGEQALFETARRSVFAEAIDDVVVCHAPTSVFLRLMKIMPRLTMELAELVAGRRTQAEMLVEGLVYLSVQGRLLRVLQQLVRDFGVPSEVGTTIDVRLSHQELASLAGTTRETCSLEMAALQRSSIIVVDKEHRIVVPDVGRLRLSVVDRVRAGLKIG